jgi:Holliday junction resolvase
MRGQKMNNKATGNGFENEFAQILYDNGFWVHLLNQNKSGQPADVIAAKNGKAHLIDCKVCSDNSFPLSRIEENQDMAMDMWKDCGNGIGWFALKTEFGIYMLTHYVMKAWRNSHSSLSPKDIYEMGIPIDKWVKKCK